MKHKLGENIAYVILQPQAHHSISQRRGFKSSRVSVNHIMTHNEPLRYLSFKLWIKLMYSNYGTPLRALSMNYTYFQWRENVRVGLAQVMRLKQGLN